MKKFITLLAVCAIGFAAIGCSKPADEATAAPAADSKAPAGAPAPDAKPADPAATK